MPRPRPDRVRLAFFGALGALGLLAAALPAARAQQTAARHGVDPFYERLLRSGQAALERGEPGTAERDLRLGCFGLLDHPPRLAEGLVHLGRAQIANGDAEGFRETFRRMLEIEKLFSAYSQASLTPRLRQEFESHAAELVPEALLASSPAFEHLLVTAEDGDGEARSGYTLPEEAAADLERARRMQSAARRASDLTEPLRLAREVADTHPRSREAQHLAAEIAYRASRWNEAVRYFRRGGNPDEERPEMLFYFAVSLYESGETEEAARVLRGALPDLPSSEYVRTYVRRILPEEAGQPEP